MDLERDFAAWAAHRDPAALTRVFDATAGRLLLLAAHLTGGATGAEDLVQATFLAAMARASTWDRSRPLWPWLTAILQNEAHMHWRRRQRRREVDLEHAATAATTQPDPAALAASDEAFAAMVAAIDALPLPYRQALRLRLVHGLQPIEIARALEQPVGTVRAQLHRGLAQLRGALPAGLAVAAAAWLAGDGALLAQVRETVLARAVAMAKTAGAATTAGLLLTGGWWTMNGKTVGVLATGAALILLLLVVSLGMPPQTGIDAGMRSRAEPAVVDVVTAQRPPGDVPIGPVRDSVGAGDAPAWPLVVTVKSPTGPIAGAAVRVWLRPAGFAEESDVPEVAREDLTTGATASDGTFRCALDALRERSALFRCTSLLFVEATAANGTQQSDIVGLPRTTAPQSFASDILLTEPIGIRGLVVDAAGAPVFDAAVHEIRGDLSEFDLYRSDARTRRDGTFALPTQADRWPERILVRDDRLGCAFVHLPPATDLATGVVSHDVGTIVLAGPAAITGQVVLGDGAPLAWQSLVVARIDPALEGDDAAIRRFLGDRRPAVAVGATGPVQLCAMPRTAADGTFACGGLDPTGLYAVCVRDALLHYTLTTARAGGSVRLVVDRQLLLLDVRGREGELLPGAAVRGAAWDPASARPSWKPWPGFPETGQVVGGAFFDSDPEGRRRILSPFGFVWCFQVTDEISQTPPLRHDVFAGVHHAEQTLVLQPALQFGALHLDVTDADGAPLSKYGIRMRHLERDLERTTVRLTPPEDGMYRELPAGRWKLMVLLGPILNDVRYEDVAARGVDEREILVLDDKTTDVRIVSKPAGRVAFRLHSAKRPEGYWQGLTIQADAGATDVPCRVHSDDQTLSTWPLETVFFVAQPAFPPGRNGFLVTVPGYEPAHCDVEVVADRLVTARVELTAR